MKTYFVTGGYGFIGSAFVLRAISEGDKVINIDKMTYAADKANLAEIENHQNYVHIEADIADNAAIAKVFAEHDIDYVVNFAAESHVDNSITGPDVFLQTNIMGVFNLLQNARKYYEEANKPNFRFLHVSTDEVYGSLKLDEEKFTEKSQYKPNSPYSSSKASSDHLVRAWNETYGLPTLTTNCSNNYGPRQHKEKLIPKVISNCLNGVEIPVYGKGENIRDWIYVEDHVAGIFLTLEKGEVGETYCFGGDCEKTNIDLVNMICQIMDRKNPQNAPHKDLIAFVTDRPGHDLRYAIDSSKGKSELGFDIEDSFENKLESTIDWYIQQSS